MPFTSRLQHLIVAFAYINKHDVVLHEKCINVTRFHLFHNKFCYSETLIKNYLGIQSYCQTS